MMLLSPPHPVLGHSSDGGDDFSSGSGSCGGGGAAALASGDVLVWKMAQVLW